ncbi:Tigger transposable element-derived protein [Mycena venus]|uniref:Tigger transposable element-derived protein n=1 Tax=Mycena venus TaxID=2733690 RepID=A0A8H6XVT1_9AGAR|nr:Tigger transposable element-derived protein [Mycena venus]
MAGQHIQSLQQKLNSGKGKKRAGNERSLSTTARMLTSAEGRALAEEKRTAQQQKKAKDDENRSQRLLANAEVIKRRTELGREGMEFAGNIKLLKAPQLKDLAWSLELDENGTREVLIERILTHFGDNESLKVDKRYVELWRDGRRRRAAAVTNDDVEQQAQPEDMLTDIQNVANGSGSPSSQSQLPPPPPPDAPYVFPDTWTPPPTHLPYNHHPLPFPQSYGNPPPSDYYSVHHPYDPSLFRF